MNKLWLSLAFLLIVVSPLSVEAATVKKVVKKPVVRVKIPPKPVGQIYSNKEFGFTLRYPNSWQAYGDAELENDSGDTADLIMANSGNVHAAVVENFDLGQLPSVTDMVVVIAGGEADYFPRQLKYAPDPEYPESVEPTGRSLLFQNAYGAAVRWMGKGIPGDEEGRWLGFTIVSSGLRYVSNGHRAVRIVALVPSGPDQEKQINALNTMVKSIQFIAPHRLKTRKFPASPIAAPADPTILP